MKKIFKYLLVFIIMIIAFCLALTITSLVPKKMIIKSVEESSEILDKQTNLYFITIKNKRIKLKFDNFTDALMVNTAFSIDTKTPFYSAMMARKNYIDGKTEIIYPDSTGELKSASKYEGVNQVGELHDTINNDITESFEYARYWHGYLIFLRPLLIFFNITEIRTILLIAFAILGLIMLYKIYKKIDLGTAIIFLLGMIICDYFYIGNSLQGTSVFLIATIASIILLSRDIKDKLMFFMVIGGITSFFDFLTVPIVTLGIPLLIYAMIGNKENSTYKKFYLEISKCCICWAVGYLGVWITKWILVDLVYNKKLISSVIEQAKYRTTNSGQKCRFLDVMIQNLSIIRLQFFWALIITIILLVIKIVKIKDLKRIKFNYKEIVIYLCIGCLGIAWYLALKQHSYRHFFFTYRNLWLISTSVLLSVYNILKITNKGKITNVEFYMTKR